jgi:hypothetical protein
MSALMSGFMNNRSSSWWATMFIVRNVQVAAVVGVMRTPVIPTRTTAALTAQSDNLRQVFPPIEYLFITEPEYGKFSDLSNKLVIWSSHHLLSWSF